MSKYNLTFWQRAGLIPVWFMWVTTPKSKRKTWHLVKKGLEKHECKFTILTHEYGLNWWNCEHEGCNICCSDDFKFKRGIFNQPPK